MYVTYPINRPFVGTSQEVGNLLSASSIDDCCIDELEVVAPHRTNCYSRKCLNKNMVGNGGKLFRRRNKCNQSSITIIPLAQLFSYFFLFHHKFHPILLSVHILTYINFICYIHEFFFFLRITRTNKRG